MKKKIGSLTLITALFFYCKSEAQNCNANGAQINSQNPGFVIKNIKTDYGAKGNGVDNDHTAFVAAASFINTHQGNVKLLIPEGIYIVGKQMLHLNNTATNEDPVYKGLVAMKLNGVDNVSIIGSVNSVIIYDTNLHFGTFNLYDGLSPSVLNLYNPSDTHVSINTGNYDKKYTGTIGNFIEMEDCANVEIKNLQIHGNNKNYILGGNWGVGDRPIELENSYGIQITNCKSITLSQLKIHHFGTDNLSIGGGFTDNDITKPKTENFRIENVYCEYSGRNGFSWVGGSNICVINSSFNNAAKTTIKTKPGYGMDIEPELSGSTIASCNNSFFQNCNFENNHKLGFTTGVDKESPIPGLRGPGYTFNHYFKNCVIVGSAQAAIHNFANRVTFDGCKFYGDILEKGSTDDIQQQAPVKYLNCFFSDCYNGKFMETIGYTLGLEYAWNLYIDGCTFEKLRPVTSYLGFEILYKGQGEGIESTIYPTIPVVACSTNLRKPVIKNSTFNYYSIPPANNVLASNVWNVKFQNNTFYKNNSTIIFNQTTGCNPGEMGNVDLGAGLVEDTISQQPDCNSRLMCQKSLYISYNENTPDIRQTSDFIISDATVTLNSGNMIYQAANYIELNPGFETNMTANGTVEVNVAPCTFTQPLINTPPPFVGLAKYQVSKTLEDKINIYPNPSNGAYEVYVGSFSNSFNENVKVNIFNNVGLSIPFKIIKKTDRQFYIQIDRSVASGAYFMRITNGRKLTTQKIIKL